MYIRELEVRNLRTFSHAQLTFNVPGDDLGEQTLCNVNLLLGDNGSGKTTILRAIALAALSPVMTRNSGWVPTSIVRRVRGTPEASASASCELVLHADDPHTGRERLSVVLKPSGQFRDYVEHVEPPAWAEPMWDDGTPGFFVVGYGAGRRVPLPDEDTRRSPRALRYARVAGLFDESVTLTPLATWLPRIARLHPHLHQEVLSILEPLLAPYASVRADASEADEYLFAVGGTPVPFEALSDGYRAYVGWVGDLLYHLAGGRRALSPDAPQPSTPLSERTGIVLIDEVDLHLHPEWQQRVIPVVAGALPRLQFVFSSHSPLVVGTLWRPNVFVLTTKDDDGVRTCTVARPDQEVYGLSADQILTSGTFGLASPRVGEFVRNIQAQAEAAKEGDPDAALQFMRMMTLGGGAGHSAPHVPRSRR